MKAAGFIGGATGPLWAALGAAMLWLAPRPAGAALHVVIIEGLGGEPTYAQQFHDQVHALVAASRTLTQAHNVQVLSGQGATRVAVLHVFHTLDGSLVHTDRVILYLVGHGSYDGRQYKFNIPGPDLTGEDLTRLLNALPAQQQLVVATGSSSGALLPLLQRPGRLLITATRNGEENNATHFGAAFAVALGSATADVDKNGAINAQEAYSFANRRVQDDYRAQTLLASEHAVLEGDGAAHFTLAVLTPSEAIAEGAAASRVVGAGSVVGAGGAALGAAQATAGLGAVPPELLRERAALNAQIQALEQRKGTLPPAQYSAQLEPLLLQLAQLQERIDQRAVGTRGDAH